MTLNSLLFSSNAPHPLFFMIFEFFGVNKHRMPYNWDLVD